MTVVNKLLPVPGGDALEYNLMACDGPNCKNEGDHRAIIEGGWRMTVEYADGDQGHEMREFHHCSKTCHNGWMKDRPEKSQPIHPKKPKP